MFKLPNKSTTGLSVENRRSISSYIIDSNHIVKPSPFHIYLGLFHKIPNQITLEYMDINAAISSVLEKWSNMIIDQNYSYELSNNTLKDCYFNIYLIPDIIIQFREFDQNIQLCYEAATNTQINEILDELSKFEISKTSQNTLGLLKATPIGLQIQPFEVQPINLDINLFYESDLKVLHEHLLKTLNEKNKKGIVLFHGEPGTGKTTYIKYLISILNKEVIFIPNHLARELDGPQLIHVLFEHQNSIIVIEDAEEILMTRNGRNNSAASTLLNLSDGLISDILQIQIICTFNTDLRNIDPAILRKGRLIARYEFKKLKQTKAQELVNILGYTHEVVSPMTLAEIFNLNNNVFSSDNENLIGFKK